VFFVAEKAYWLLLASNFSFCLRQFAQRNPPNARSTVFFDFAVFFASALLSLGIPLSSSLHSAHFCTFGFRLWKVSFVLPPGILLWTRASLPDLNFPSTMMNPWKNRIFIKVAVAEC
jgi:hypothetical protein